MAERADDGGARCSKRLLGRPQAFLPLGGAHEDQTIRIKPELKQSRRVWRAILGEHALFARPNHAGLPGPAGGKGQTEAQSRRFRAWTGRTQLMQRLARHNGRHPGKTGLLGGWTRTHVPYMFYTPDSR